MSRLMPAQSFQGVPFAETVMVAIRARCDIVLGCLRNVSSMLPDSLFGSFVGESVHASFCAYLR